MKWTVISIRDRGAQIFMQPQHVQTPGIAIRGFQDEVQAGNNSTISKHPEDFDLYALGLWDDDNGRYELHADPQILVRGQDLKNQRN